MNTPLSQCHEWPTLDGGRCNLRGVLKITPPKWAQSVSYHMAAENSTLFSLNIGDSLTNNAWGKEIPGRPNDVHAVMPKKESLNLLKVGQKLSKGRMTPQ